MNLTLINNNILKNSFSIYILNKELYSINIYDVIKYIKRRIVHKWAFI